MRVLSGRASCGARAALRALLGGAFAFLGLIAGGCGNTTYTYGTPVITFSAVPGPFSAYVIEIQSIALTRKDGTVVYPLITPEYVDFTKLTDLTELFGAPGVLEGTYVSATIALSFAPTQFPPQVFANINGTNQAVKVYDGNATASSSTPSTPIAASTITYTVKFDPNVPLNIKNGTSTPLDFNFDLSAASVLNPSSSPVSVMTRPVLTASTKPLYNKTLHARGVYVVNDSAGFTINSRAFFDTLSNPVGAIEIQTDANTAFNINGALYTGAAGLAAMKALPLNSLVEAYGALGTLNAAKPNFIATQVYAGTAVENLAVSRLTGTVSARTATTLTIHGAELSQYVGGAVLSGDAVCFYAADIPVTVGPQTLVSVDGQPGISSPSTQLISVGQRVSIIGAGNSSLLNGCAAVTSMDATAGLIRLKPTTAWGTVTAASSQPTSGTVDLTSLGGYQPAELTFTGTGSATGADANPTAYVVNNTSGVDLTTIPANTLVELEGLVTPYGSAPPDFTASSVTKASDADQVLVLDWVAPGSATGGSATPFLTVDDAGLTVNISDPSLGASHFVQAGPMYIQTAATTVDLTNPKVNVRIVPDPVLTGQFAVGNASSTQYSVFHDYLSFRNQLGNVVLNGTNKIISMAAVGKWDVTSGTFTAHRIDIVQTP